MGWLHERELAGAMRFPRETGGPCTMTNCSLNGRYKGVGCVRHIPYHTWYPTLAASCHCLAMYSYVLAYVGQVLRGPVPSEV